MPAAVMVGDGVDSGGRNAGDGDDAGDGDGDGDRDRDGTGRNTVTR
ncbi:MAG: hypothetical protein OXU62_00795 [Gammaproteobacteria bacterium]|nr:hypothetical protein [Gammaproteobacteria bacterium]